MADELKGMTPIDDDSLDGVVGGVGVNNKAGQVNKKSVVMGKMNCVAGKNNSVNKKSGVVNKLTTNNTKSGKVGIKTNKNNKNKKTTDPLIKKLTFKESQLDPSKGKSSGGGGANC